MKKINIVFTTGVQISATRQELMSLMAEPVVIAYALAFGLGFGYLVPQSFIEYFTPLWYFTLIAIKSLLLLFSIHAIFYILHGLMSYARSIPVPTSISLILATTFVEAIWINAMHFIIDESMSENLAFWSPDLLKIIVGIFLSEIIYSIFILRMTRFWVDSRTMIPHNMPSIASHEAKNPDTSTPELPHDQIDPKSMIFGKEYIVLSELIYVKAEQHYVKFTTGRKSIFVRCRFSNVIEKLPSSLGTQVHRSFWVAFSAIQDIELYPDGRGEVAMTNSDKIPVSRAFRKKLVDMLATRS